ncbi:hypothetical protein POM88_020711 [Heracleum sosnowskyi]|uniref:Helitron helicase-like domain-containing protein n=1 Tax=Heracleum sosnowskyi TaxID=360622 RepID=A0AAD8IDG6_9APIA|nr:hypothetical protein POM88_020711 [Heracleum sosnowskyi]
MSCAPSWDRESLIRELDYVGRIFRWSEDSKGRKLFWKCEEIIDKLKGGLTEPVVSRATADDSITSQNTASPSANYTGYPLLLMVYKAYEILSAFQDAMPEKQPDAPKDIKDGYHDEIPYVHSNTQSKKKRKRITMKEYYSYKLQVSKDEGLHVRLAGHLYQQYVVDAFSCIEQAHLWWLRTHQTELRSDLYSTVAKKYVSGESEISNVGKGFILPVNFLGSQRYMQQNFQDALAVYRAVGHPDIFLTISCNPLWDEILQMMKVVPGCSPQDSPDIVARVFHLKLEQLLDDIKKKNYFGTCLGVMYFVEFQKRGHDRATIEITSHKQKKEVEDEEAVDEINAYFDGRYICASEASYRIFGFPIHHRSISVVRLSFHFLVEKSCTFTENETLEKVVRCEKFKHSQLESFFILNRSDPNARQYTYDQILQHYVWNETDRIRTIRKKGKQIGRLLYTHHSAGELWYLRLLLSNIRGPTSFEALKTINGVQYRTF